MTDSEKEAAIARLAVRFEEYLDQGEDLWTTLARIAIEQGVVPFYAAIIQQIKDEQLGTNKVALEKAGEDDYWLAAEFESMAQGMANACVKIQNHIPWDAVCAEEK